jgi:hypothetical protein
LDTWVFCSGFLDGGLLLLSRELGAGLSDCCATVAVASELINIRTDIKAQQFITATPILTLALGL